MIKHQMFIAAALFAGVAIGYFVKDEPIPEEEPKVETAVKKPLADKGEEASVKALRHRIAELEKLLAERDGKSEVAIADAAAETEKARIPDPSRGGPQEWVDNLKKSDPERYTQMTNRIAQWRQRRSERTYSTISFLSSIDVSHMSARARKTHGELQGLLAKREELEQQAQQEDLPWEKRGALMKEIWSMQHDINRLNGEERRNLLDETARNLGFEGEDAAEISATIQDVIRATDSGFGHHPGGGHGGGPRGPGGPGGR